MSARGLVRLLLTVLLLGGAGATAHAHPTRSMLPPPSFRPAPGWWTVTTGPTSTSQQLPPQVWAISTVGSNVGALVPFDLFQGLKRLSPRGIVIWAMTIGPKRVAGFPRASLPLRLSQFRVDHGWEMQPAANIQQRLRWVRVHGWQLDVRVYFATQHPSRKLLSQAQAELDRLLLPGAR